MPMGEHITNFSIDELISSYIDNQIDDPEQLKKVKEMLSKDEILTKKYESELLTKKLLAARLKNVEVPPACFMKLSGAIEEIINTAKRNENARVKVEPHPIAESSSFFDYLKRVLTAPMKIASVPVPRYAPALVLMVMVVTAGVMITNQQNRHGNTNSHLMTGSEKNIVKQAVSNFHNILDGKIIPDKVSQNATEVKTMLSKQSEFAVYIPEIKEYKLSGVICNEYNGQKLCHLVYSSGDDLIYIYQVKSQCLERKDLEMPDEVRTEISSNKFFMCDEVDPQNCTVTVWYKDNITLASVTNLPKHKMNSTFASFK
jgi:hypothetical protein